MFSELYALAETFVNQTAAPVNTPEAGLACLAAPVNNNLHSLGTAFGIFSLRDKPVPVISFQTSFKNQSTRHTARD